MHYTHACIGFSPYKSILIIYSAPQFLVASYTSAALTHVATQYFKGRLNYDIRIKNTTSPALPQPYREKALSHIEEESDDMYNETKGNGSIEDKKVNPLQHFRPTKKRHFTKPTSLITNRRTTIPFPKLGLAHDTSAHGSGGESGSGDHFVSAHEHHQKQVHPHRITKVFLSTKTKQHTGNLVELKRAGKITIFLKLLLHSQLNQPFTMLFFD